MRDPDVLRTHWLRAAITAACLVPAVGFTTGCADEPGVADTDGTGSESETGTDDTSTSSTDGGTEPSPAAMQFSEVMYHPVLEQAFVDRHEFVEIHNPGAESVELGGWRLDGGVDFSFAPGTSIDAGGYLVIARDPAALLAIGSYALDPSQVVGPYQGELENGDEFLILRRDDDTIADTMGYDDGFPWPIAADALGAGESWLAPELLPLEDHRYRGVSLERVSLSVSGDEVGNWTASELDDPSPGRAFAGLRAEPLPILIRKDTSTASPDPLIREGEAVTLDLEFSEFGALSDVRVDYFVDDVEVAGEPVASLAVSDAEFVGRTVAVELPGQAANSIVRYRVFADRGAGVELVSPRPSDPNDYHAYFVSPVVDSDARVYQLFLASDQWAQMWTNIEAGREQGCEASPTWNDRVPGVFVYEGQVHDVQVRYQGSRWNRFNGPDVDNWPHAGPSAPSPLRGLSYRIAFPRYDRFEGRKVLALNKLTQGCPGLSSAVGFELFRRMSLPASVTSFARLHINGGYFRYMLEIERPGEEMMEAYHEAMAADPLNVEPVGHLFKSVGLNADAGPFGWGDGRPLAESCGHDINTRYAATYDRKTHTWDNHAQLIAMLEELDSYRDPFDGSIDVLATQLYLEEHFDVEAMLDHIVIMNWSIPFDDYFQNYFLYQRRSDARWSMVAWDLDQNFGPWAAGTGSGPQASIFGGRNGQDVAGGIDANRSGWWNRVKDSFLRAYEDEYIDRMKMHAGLTLHPDEVAAIVDEIVAAYDIEEANAAASSPSCDIDGAAAQFKAFAAARHAYVIGTPAADLVDW
ncbi:CotH kinase family protein [Enhygromyxa salina]|uniref:CotH protein n=1 Tax=Enhygromyxa salina TaxID=215803 RepID=A0A2S9XKZ9_9BACT|nr:CotH kinase family protein [Enhygromyxa salina]PRP93512.1 CotH protein [Enhygromyxa salina]